MLRLTVAAPGVEIAECVMAEAWAAGALGVVEREGEAGVVLLDIYVPRADEPAARRALDELAHAQVRLLAVEPVDDQNWSQAWKQGLEAIAISDRLVVRPSFVEFDAAPGQQVLVIDPGQAFGTGGHASTHLALEWIDAWAAGSEGTPRLVAGARVLDVGTGSGVLALAALALGADSAVGLDLDPVAVREAAVVAADNGLAERCLLYAGGLEALSAGGFDLVLANLLKREMLEVAPAIAASVAPGGGLVLSGLIERDGPEVLRRFASEGLAPGGERRRLDASGETWIAPLLMRPL